MSTGRRTALADAAIQVLGERGLRALTHRAVDAAAGLPAGTCSYHYPNRRTLLDAALNRVAQLDQHDATAALMAAAAAQDGRSAQEQPSPEAASADALAYLQAALTNDPVGTLTRLLTDGLLAEPVRTRARLVMTLDPEARRELGETAQRAADGFVTRSAELLGSASRGRLFVALLDGLVIDQLSRGTSDRAQLRGAVAAIWQAVRASP